MVDARIYNRCEPQAYRTQFMIEEARRYCGAWINSQPSLFPWLEEELDPLTVRLERLIIILDTLGLDAFVAKAVLTAASTHDSQAAIPLARLSRQRVVWLCDVMDSAYD